MPRFSIYEQDNTGSSPVEDLAVVFVPGEVAIATNKEDANHCIYIPSVADNLGEYFEDPNFEYSVPAEDGAVKIDVRHLAQILTGLGYGVIYMDVTKATAEDYVYTITNSVDEETDFETEEYYIFRNNAYIRATEYSVSETYFTRTIGTYIGWNALTKTPNGWNFLNDRNAYDIKFITTGNHFTVPVISGNDATSYITAQGTQIYGFNFELANRTLTIPTNRKDCALLLDLEYDASEISLNANTLASDFKTALECRVENNLTYMLTKVQTNSDLSETCVSSRAYTLFSNCLMDYSSARGAVTLTVPGSLTYLYQYATINNISINWLPISGVNRGVVEEVFMPDIELSKYFLDTQIIDDGEGVSFNGVVNVRPYGYTIWGDRTLLQQEATRGVQATSYMSLRNLVSDIAKTAYNSAIRYTFETNNDATWLNFKQVIVTLLDQMVSSGVLQTYKIGKVTPKEYDARNTIAAKIIIYPNLPVENFEVYVNLENAEITTTADDIAA